MNAKPSIKITHKTKAVRFLGSVFSSIRSLDNAYTQLLTDEAQLQKEKSDLTQQLTQTSNLLSTLQSHFGTLKNELETQKKQYSQLEFVYKNTSQELEKSKLMVFNVEKEKNQLSLQLNESDGQLSAEKTNHLKLQQEHKVLQETLSKIKQQYLALQKTLQEHQKIITEKNMVIARLEQDVASVQVKLQETELEAQQLKNKLQQTESELTHAKAELDNLSIEYQKIRSTHEELHKQYEALNNDHIALNTQLTDLTGRYNLIKDMLSLKVESTEFYLQVKDALDNELLPFINSVTVLDNEAELAAELLSSLEKLHILETMQKFQNKNIVAVTGGFSAGKSSFISSLFDDDAIKLAASIKPTTAIPTYVFHANDFKITAFNRDFGSGSVEHEVYSQLTHLYLKEFGFNLLDLIPFFSFETPIEQYPHLGFIDLPGYDPASSSIKEIDDHQTAASFITQAQSIFWLIGLDANGTIPSTDFEFIQNNILDKHPNIPIFFILNKADIKPLDVIEQIVDEIAERLEENQIPFQGISAYSSRKKMELYHHPDMLSLDEILAEWNQPFNAYEEIFDEIISVIDIYNTALSSRIKLLKNNSDLLQAIDHMVYELGAFDSIEDDYFNHNEDERNDKIKNVEDNIKSIHTFLDPSKYEKKVVELKNIKAKIISLFTDNGKVTRITETQPKQGEDHWRSEWFGLIRNLTSQ